MRINILVFWLITFIYFVFISVSFTLAAPGWIGLTYMGYGAFFLFPMLIGTLVLAVRRFNKGLRLVNISIVFLILLFISHIGTYLLIPEDCGDGPGRYSCSRLVIERLFDANYPTLNNFIGDRPILILLVYSLIMLYFLANAFQISLKTKTFGQIGIIIIGLLLAMLTLNANFFFIAFALTLITVIYRLRIFFRNKKA